MDAQRNRYDVVVVGAKFSGATFARVCAGRGLRVLVLEKDREIGKIVRTTGVIFTELLEILDIPRHLLLNDVNTIHFYPPRGEPLHISAPLCRFFMSDTPQLLEWLVEQAEAYGAEFARGVKFSYVERDRKGIIVGCSHDGVSTTVKADFLIGADGPVSSVAKATNLRRNINFLLGLEWSLDGIEIEPTAFHLIFNPSLAPGHCAWLAPRGSQVALGVAGYAREFRPSKSLEEATHLFSRHVRIPAGTRIVGRRAGLIPVRATKAPFHNSHVLLIGDAAGLCGVASGQGIFQAVLSGKLAGRYVSEYLDGRRDALAEYAHNLAASYNLESYLSFERRVRTFIDSMRSEEEWGLLFDLFRRPDYQQFLIRGLLSVSIPQLSDFGCGALARLACELPYVRGSVVDLARLTIGTIWKRRECWAMFQFLKRALHGDLLWDRCRRRL